MQIECSNCETIFKVDEQDFDCQEEVDERGMGIHREIWCELDIECPNPECGQNINITTNETEYPEGNFEKGDSRVTGGRIV